LTLCQRLCTAHSFPVVALGALASVLALVAVPDDIAALVLVDLGAAVNAPVISRSEKCLAEVRHLLRAASRPVTEKAYVRLERYCATMPFVAPAPLAQVVSLRVGTVVVETEPRGSELAEKPDHAPGGRRNLPA
jgi:hypothetical protein